MKKGFFLLSILLLVGTIAGGVHSQWGQGLLMVPAKPVLPPTAVAPLSVSVQDTTTNGTVIAALSCTVPSGSCTFNINDPNGLVKVVGTNLAANTDYATHDGDFSNIKLQACNLGGCFPNPAANNFTLHITAPSTGPPAPPTEAQQAGFTTCIVCMDFTTTPGKIWINGTLDSRDATQVSTWLNCSTGAQISGAGPGSNGHVNGLNNWIWDWSTPPGEALGPCPDIASYLGVQNLRFITNAGDSQVSGNWGNGMLAFDSRAPGGTTGFLTPTFLYQEATYIYSSYPLQLGPPPDNNWIPYSQGFWVGQLPAMGGGPGGNANGFEFDSFEIGGPYNIVLSYASGMNWTLHGGPCNWGGTIGCGPDHPPLYPSGAPMTGPNYIVDGMRITGDSSGIYKCQWTSHVFENCVSWPSAGAAYPGSSLTDGSSRQVSILGLTQEHKLVASGAEGWPPGTQMIAHLAKLNIWSCANWLTTACATPGNPNPGGYPKVN